MNLYFKLWNKQKDCDKEMHDIYGFKATKHVTKKYDAWTLSLFGHKNVLDITFTTNNKAYTRDNKMYLKDEIDYSIFPIGGK